MLSKERHQTATGPFIYGSRPKFAEQRNEIWLLICERVSSEKYLNRDSETVHLLLDSLAFPHVDRTKRAKLLRASWNRVGANLGNISVIDAETLIDEIQQQHWFVRWDGVNLLNMIEKKELSSVYA